MEFKNDSSPSTSGLSSSPSTSGLSSPSTSGASSPSTSELSSLFNDQFKSAILRCNSVNSTDSVRLEMVVQPAETFGFRNESEVEKYKNGILKGRNNKKNPTVQLVGYRSSNNVLITCTPIGMKNKTELCIHPYRLVKRDRTLLSEGVMDPIKIIAENQKKYLVQIKATIMIPEKKESLYLRDGTPITNETRKNYDLQKMCLRFDAYELVNGQQGNQIAKPIYSDPIGNSRSVSTTKLEIKELFPVEGSVTGKTRVWARCERVDIKDIQVRFSIGDLVKSAKIEHVHHQYLVIFDTPTFKNLQNITEPVYVDVQLERKSDGSLSEKTIFKYTPWRKSLKRCSSDSNSSSSNYESDSNDHDDDNDDDDKVLTKSKSNKIRKLESKSRASINANVKYSKIEYKKMTDNMIVENIGDLSLQCDKIDIQNVNFNDNESLKATTADVNFKDSEIQHLVNDNSNAIKDCNSEESLNENIAASNNDQQNSQENSSEHNLQENSSQNDTNSNFEEDYCALIRDFLESSLLDYHIITIDSNDTADVDHIISSNEFGDSDHNILMESEINDSNINNCG